MTSKKTNFMRLLAAIVMIASMMALFTGCGEENNNGGNAEGSTYESAVDILNAVWGDGDHDFPAYGGNFEATVDNAPGALNTEDTDTMTNMLLIPADVQGKVKDAATIFHMMNANTFTGAALKLDGMTADEAAGKIKDAFKSNQFMCGIPDKIMIYTVGDSDLVYFFGAADILDELKADAEKLDGGKLAVDEAY